METQHSRLPAGEGSVDAMVGVRPDRARCWPRACRQAARPRPCAHRADRARPGRRAGRADDAEGIRVPMALVHDEYGHFEGIVTPADILEAITGVFRADADAGDEPALVTRGRVDGCSPATCRPTRWPTISASTCPRTATTRPSPAMCCRISTICRRPARRVDAQGWRFEVVDLDGRRIDKIIAYAPAGGAPRGRALGSVDIQVRSACKWRPSALPVLTYEKYAPLRFSNATIFGSPYLNLNRP